MYCKYFGFSEKPFDVTPDPRFLYLTTDHEEALSSIIYGIQERRGFITIVGEVGTGKTTLLNAVLDSLDNQTKAAMITNTDISFEQMLNMALYEWGLLKSNEQLSRLDAINKLNAFAIEQTAIGGNVVLIIDEAQLLSNNTLERLRLLSNLETRKYKLVQIVLSGQPELDIKLGQHELRQFTQRISLRRYITPLNKKETFAYLQHRIKIASATRIFPFSKGAQQLIWEYSNGIPRKINMVCDNSFLIGYGLKQKKISEKIVKEAAIDLHMIWPFKNESTVDPSVLESADTNDAKNSPSQLAKIFFSGSLIFAACIFIGIAFFGLFKFIHFSQNSQKVYPETIPSNLVHKGTITPFISDEIVSQKEYQNIRPQKPEQQNELIAASALENSFIASPSFNDSINKTEGEKMAFNVVKKGETLRRIITRFYGEYNTSILEEVMQENDEIKDPNKIFKDQIIKLPISKNQITKRVGE
ncbi:MAG: AAA family ATPase [Desulfobacterales bacterium]|nr:AAA family ATPase [Desulfobacterales bacterium]